MNSKLLIGFVVVVIIVVIGFTVLGGNKNQTQTSNATQTVGEQPTTQSNQTQNIQKTEDAIVTVDSSGFSPNTLTVKAGTRVIWANKTGGDISVNSVEHPTHQLHRELNLGHVPNDSNASVVFEKAGTYKYHDHYNPSHTGTVVVE